MQLPASANKIKMQKLIVLVLCFMAVNTMAQPVINPYPKTITVNGSAEMEVIPDEIYVQVDLREYQKKGEGKITLESIKNNFLAGVRSIGIADSLVTIASYEGYAGYPWWKRRKRDPEMYASIAYQIKLTSSYKLDQLVTMLDDDATANFQVVRTSHSKIQEFRKQLKIQAIKAAKEKAEYLLEAIDEKRGDAVTITEPNDMSVYYFSLANKGYFENSNTKLMQRDQMADGQQAIDFRKIKLKFDVSVVYALK